MDFAVKTERLCKSYRGRPVVKDVSFALERGAAMAIVGANGSGKTTLMRILAGLAVADSGSVSLLGAEGERALRAARQRVGFLIEAPIGYGSLPVRKNLLLRAGLYGKPDRDYIEELMERLQLTEKDVGNGRLSLLSYGQKGRYGLAAALVNRPELLVLDEPFNGIDKENVASVCAFLNELREQRGVTLFLSGHVTEQLRLVCPQALVMEGGVLSGPVPIDSLKGGEADEGPAP